MSGCRIGKVTFKDRKIVALPQLRRFHCHTSADNFRNQIDKDTKAVAFFVLNKNGQVSTGLSYGGGTFLAEMLGSTEILKQDIDYHWATPEEPTPDESA